MSSEPRISPRERLVLNAIIETYIATGEPVASQAVARLFDNQDGLSSATIRNVMAALGDAGLLEQPHTSSGRIPTAQAFRFYVEQLTAICAHGAGCARAGTAGSRLKTRFTGVHSQEQFLERTSHVLALDFERSGFSCSRECRVAPLSIFHFSRLSTGRVLAVVVTQSGAVLDRVLALDRDLSIAELRRRPRPTSTRIFAAGRLSACAAKWRAGSKAGSAN